MFRNHGGTVGHSHFHLYYLWMVPVLFIYQDLTKVDIELGFLSRSRGLAQGMSNTEHTSVLWQASLLETLQIICCHDQYNSLCILWIVMSF